MASEFTYTNPEAAKQAIARLQLQAALAENQSRENIAHEQTNAQRYATQSQIAEREKDRQVSREDIAARYGYNSRANTDASARERAKLQLDTLTDRVRNNIGDPPTKNEVESWFSKTPDLSDDQRNAVRSLRDDAYKAAKSNYNLGKQKADNYTSELAALKRTPNPKTQDSLYKRLNGDKDIIFDAATGNVASSHRMPREDAPTTSGMMGAAGYSAGGKAISPSQDYGGGGASIPTIADIKAKVTGAPAGQAISPSQDYGGAALPPTASTITTPAPVEAESPSMVWPGVPTFSGIGRAIGNNVAVSPTAGITFPNLSMGTLVGPAAPRDPMQGPMQRFQTPGGFGVRVSDLAPPPSSAIQPPAFVAPRPAQTLNLPQYQSPAGNMEALLNIARHPDFGTLPPAHQQWIMDEIGNAAPRAYDMQTIRPEFRPPLDYYAPQ